MAHTKPTKGKVIVFGILFWYPLAGVTFQFLHYLIGLPVERIARDCGLPAGTVKTRIAAGRRRLERELGEHPEEVCDAR